MATPKKKSTTSRATPKGTAPRKPVKRATVAKQPTKRSVKIQIDGNEYELNDEMDLTPKQSREFRTQTGMSFAATYNLLFTDPDIDVLVPLIWQCERLNGDERSYDDFESSISYKSDVSIDISRAGVKDLDPET